MSFAEDRGHIPSPMILLHVNRHSRTFMSDKFVSKLRNVPTFKKSYLCDKACGKYKFCDPKKGGNVLPLYAVFNDYYPNFLAWEEKKSIPSLLF